MVGPGGEVVEPVSVFLRDLLASGKPESTLRSYSVDLLRWWRFLDAIGVEWDRASRTEARDFSCWIQLTAKQRLQTSRPRAARLFSRVPGAPHPVTGKPAAGDGYAPSTVAHSETALRRCYDFHRDSGTGPVLNPFPLDASRRRGRPHAHHHPMDEWMPERTGRYRPTVPKRIPPRAVGELLGALRTAGATAISPPCCAACSKHLQTFTRKGQDWYCGSCEHHRASCAGCGKTTRVKALDRNGQPRCAQCCDVDDRDPISVIYSVVAELDSQVGRDTIAAAVVSTSRSTEPIQPGRLTTCGDDA